MQRQRRAVGTEVIVYYSVSRWGPAGLPCDGQRMHLSRAASERRRGDRGEGWDRGKYQAKNSFLRTAFRAVRATAIDVLILMPPALQ